eukprot:134929-Alexandrium_andersonii.AAC.1
MVVAAVEIAWRNSAASPAPALRVLAKAKARRPQSPSTPGPTEEARPAEKRTPSTPLPNSGR